MQNVIELSAAVRELLWSQKNNKNSAENNTVINVEVIAQISQLAGGRASAATAAGR